MEKRAAKHFTGGSAVMRRGSDKVELQSCYYAVPTESESHTKTANP
jgi:hypothetical protein